MIIMKFNKDFNRYIITLTISFSFLFLFTGIAYSCPKDSLRVPVGQESTYERVIGAMHQGDNKASAINRLENFIDAIRKGKYQQGALVDLRNIPAGRKIILVGDLHARKDNLEKILSNIEAIKKGEAILIILGDAVHSETKLEKMDSSVEIMQLIMDLKIQNPDNVYYVLGNHDYLSPRFRKGSVRQGILYKDTLLKLFGEEYITLYEEFIKNSPLMAIGKGFVGIHAGPVKGVNLEDIKNVDVSNEEDKIVHQALWNRFVKGDYDANDVYDFMERMGQPNGILIVGHSPARDGEWHWELMPNHHIIFAGSNKCGYAVVRNGKVNFVDATNADRLKFAKAQERPIDTAIQAPLKPNTPFNVKGPIRITLGTDTTLELLTSENIAEHYPDLAKELNLDIGYFIIDPRNTTGFKAVRIGESFIIGRENPGRFTLPNTVSRRHVKITRVNGDDFIIEDLGSTNGTTIQALVGLTSSTTQTKKPYVGKNGKALWQTEESLHDFMTLLQNNQPEFDKHFETLRNLYDRSNITAGGLVRAIGFFTQFSRQGIISNDNDLDKLFQSAEELRTQIGKLIMVRDDNYAYTDKGLWIGLYDLLDGGIKIYNAQKPVFIKRVERQSIAISIVGEEKIKGAMHKSIVSYRCVGHSI